MRRFSNPILTIFALFASVGACDKVDFLLETPPPPPFEIIVHVASDPGKPLAGAEIRLEDKTVGTTNQSGEANVQFTGHEGDTVDLTARCPVEFESPEKPFSVTLRRLAQGSRLQSYEVRCPPLLRTAVVGIRAENGPNLPILRLGRSVGRTDAAGSALVMMSVKPGEMVELTLATSDKTAAELRPQNPVVSFQGKPHDDFVVLDQHFTVEHKASAPKGPPRPPRPTPL